jgi:hypothetical protein
VSAHNFLKRKSGLLADCGGQPPPPLLPAVRRASGQRFWGVAGVNDKNDKMTRKYAQSIMHAIPLYFLIFRVMEFLVILSFLSFTHENTAKIDDKK